MYHIMQQGKQGLDGVLLGLGRLLADSILERDREGQAGPNYQPKTSEAYKWAAQPSSAFVADQKIPVMRPRLPEPGRQ